MLRVLTFIFLMLLTVRFCSYLSKPAEARTQNQETALLLARTCVAEISFQKTVDECILMWNINRNRARLLRRSIIVQTMKFNSYWKSKKHRAKRPWIAHLNGDHAPDKWPSIMAWRNYKKRWIAYRSAAYKFVDNPKAFPMKCDAVDYGGPNEIPIGARTGQLERIECLDGKTLQWYWGKAK